MAYRGMERGAGVLCVCVPLLIFDRARLFRCPRALSGVYLCGRRMVVWVAAASPLMVRPSLCSMASPW